MGQTLGDSVTAGTAIVTRNNDLALSGPLGSLDAYLDRVSRIPVLSREQERELADRFRRQNDLCASSSTLPAATAATACRWAI